MLKFYGYKKCGTSRKGEAFLNKNEISFEFIDITLNPPDTEELAGLINQSNKPVKKFFNTSGVVYREMQLKDKLKTMTDDEMIDLLASNGKLIKRPIVSDGKQTTVAFSEDEFNATWL